MSDLEWMEEQGVKNIKLEEYNGFCIKPESWLPVLSLLQNSKRKSRPMVLNWSLFCIQGTSISDWRYFHCHNLRVCYWHWGAESRDAAKHPTVRRTAPTAENHPAPDSSHAQVDRNSGLGMHLFLVPYGLLDRQIIWFWMRSSDPEIPGNN